MVISMPKHQTISVDVNLFVASIQKSPLEVTRFGHKV